MPNCDRSAGHLLAPPVYISLTRTALATHQLSENASVQLRAASEKFISSGESNCNAID
jgi:hypothetical protein